MLTNIGSYLILNGRPRAITGTFPINIFYGKSVIMGKSLNQAKRKMKQFTPKIEYILKKKRRKAQRPRHNKGAAEAVAVEQNRTQTERAVRPNFVLDPLDTKPPISDFTWATSKRRRP